jgi:predicted Zn-dependent peptidase
VAELRDHGPSESELARARPRAAWQTRALLAEPLEHTTFLGLSLTSGRSDRLEERHRELSAIDRTKVMEAAAHVFAPGNLVVALVGRQRAAQRKRIESAVRAFR